MTMHATLTLDVRGIPEVLAAVRAEVAEVLREEAAEEGDPRVARRLTELAAAFEAGQRPEGEE